MASVDGQAGRLGREERRGAERGRDCLNWGAQSRQELGPEGLTKLIQGEEDTAVKIVLVRAGGEERELEAVRSKTQ